MKAFLAFTKKELIEQVRTSKLMVLALVFSLFGVMNPAGAKLTPWLLPWPLREWENRCCWRKRAARWGALVPPDWCRLLPLLTTG